MSSCNFVVRFALALVFVGCYAVWAEDKMPMKDMKDKDDMGMMPDKYTDGMPMKDDGLAMKEKMRVKFCDKVSDTKILSRAVECFSQNAPEKMKKMWDFCKMEVNQSKVEEIDLVKNGCNDQQKEIFYKFVTCLETEEGKMANMKPSEQELAQWKELGHCMESLFM